MTDTTIKKVDAAQSPVGREGQIYLVSGKGVSMRMWQDEAPTDSKAEHTNAYETVGYALAGKAILELAGQQVTLEPGSSWLVPSGAPHRYVILESFTAVEATAPPAQVHGRDD
jgi:quercetin dioxygenase-like cupin family protein